MRKRLTMLLGALLALALVAAACGNDDDGDDTGTAPEEATETAEEEEQDLDETEEEMLDEEAEEPTEEATEEAEDGDEAAAAGTVDIGGGALIDTAACPGEWDNNAGVSDDEIRLGISIPRTGALAGFGTIADGMQIYFDTVGPIDGREVVIVDRDDAYDAARTRTNVEEIIDTEDVLGFSWIIGSPNNVAVRDLLNEECIPQMFASTGLPIWGDPNNYPWTNGGLLPYNSEANIWCQHIVDEFGEGATVAALYMNNDFGVAYQTAFNECADELGLDVVEELLHDPAAESVTNEITTLAATDAQAVVLGTTGAFCPQSVATINGSPWEPLMLVSATCQAIGLFWVPIEGAADGFRMVTTIKDVGDPVYADDEWVQFVRESLEAEGIDPESESYQTGFVFARHLQEVLEGAAAMEGGINRANVMASSWQLNYEHPASLGGVPSITDGANDAYLVEAGQIAVFEFDPDAGAGTYVGIGDVISFEGEAGVFSG